MTFGEAMAHMRAGKMARRECWDTLISVDKAHKDWTGIRSYHKRFMLPPGLRKELGDYYEATETDRNAKDWATA